MSLPGSRLQLHDSPPSTTRYYRYESSITPYNKKVSSPLFSNSSCPKQETESRVQFYQCPQRPEWAGVCWHIIPELIFVPEFHTGTYQYNPLTSVSRPALRPTQPPIQWVTRVPYSEVKRGRVVTLTTHPIQCRDREWVGANHPLPLRLRVYFLHFSDAILSLFRL
jgi:hypothetical protein